MSTQDARPVPLRVRLPFATEAEFLERFGANLTRGGVFIPTRALKPEGSALRFELVLADGTRLLRGEALVAHAQVDPGGSRSGMTLRFVRLDAASQAWLERLFPGRGGSLEPAPPESGAPPSPPEVRAPAPSPARPAPPPGVAPHAEVMPAELGPGAAPRPAGLQPRATPRAPAPAVPGPPPPPAPAREEPSSPRAEELPRAREGRSEPRARTPVPGSLPTVEPVRRPELEPVLGVDVGTSAVRVAVHRQGAVELLTPAGGEPAGVPFLVARGDGAEVAVGEAALAVQAQAPGRVASGIKRLLGRRGRSGRMLEHALQSVAPIVTDAQGNAALQLGPREVGAVELTADLLRALAERASRQLGEPVRRAVLGVPAHFTDAQRVALREAGERAGLEVLHLLNEPSAAALAFGHGRALARKRLLVYDLGGGTFDVSVVEVTGDDVEVVSTGGDPFLGGIDFDARVEYELRRRLAELGLTPPEPASPEGFRLRDASERAKCALSTHEQVVVTLSGVARDAAGAPADLATALTRARLEELTEDLVERSLEVTLEVLRSAAIAPQSLDEVLLLGGQGRSPHVRRRLEEALGRAVRSDVDVGGMVARGAALLGHALTRAGQGKGRAVPTEVLSTPLGIAERGGGFRRVLERNTRLPAEKTLALAAIAGEPLAVVLCQGSAPLVEDTELLGAYTLTPERDGEVLVHLAMGADGTVSLAVTPPGGKRAPVRLDRAEPDAEGWSRLLAAAPPGEAPPPPPGGLLGGLRRLFGRR